MTGNAMVATCGAITLGPGRRAFWNDAPVIENPVGGLGTARMAGSNHGGCRVPRLERFGDIDICHKIGDPREDPLEACEFRPSSLVAQVMRVMSNLVVPC